MIVTHEREKLIQAMNFFVRNTNKCGKTKLYKLLYFLDFQHFMATGRSVTGLSYFAWPMGPVPVSLHNELDHPEPDLADAFGFSEREVRSGSKPMLVLTPKSEFSARHFSKREKTLLQRLASEYRDSDAESMIEATHLENLPWHKIYYEQERRQAEIPYDLAVRKDEVDIVRQVADERAELLEKLR